MGNQNPIVDLFNEITKDLNIINCNVYNEDSTEFIYYNKENEWIFFQDVKNGDFLCNYNGYWEFFKYKFKLGYLEIQAITKLLVEQSSLCNSKVEDALKLDIGAHFDLWNIYNKMIEDVLKREIGTPDLPILLNSHKVEDALKRKLL